MVKSSTLDYIMEDPREAARLEAKVDRADWVQKYIAQHIRAGMDVLSLGCGPGILLAAICDLHPSVRGTGVDISRDRVTDAMQRHRANPRMRFVCGDAQFLELASNSFDVVYSRMLMQYLPKKEQALSEMFRVCRPGGKVLLQDLDGQLLWHYPEDPGLQRALEKTLAGLAETGFDPFVGRKLFWLGQKAGLENLKVQVESYHLIAGEIKADVRKQWELKLDIARPQMARVLGSEREAREHSKRFLEYLSRPDTLTYSTVFTVTGEKPL